MFAKQPPPANIEWVWEFYAHRPVENNPYTYLRGRAIPIADVVINAYFGLNIETDEHNVFVAALTAEDYEKMKAELCMPGTK